MLVGGSLLIMAWLATAQPQRGLIVSSVEPTGVTAGDVWSDTTSGTLKRYTGSAWEAVGGGSGESVPSGSILLIASGSCPTGYSEETSLNGKTLVGTLAANGNVGTTGGSDTITPAGTVSQPTLTMNSFSAVINHTHDVTVTDPGHSHVENSNGATTGGLRGWPAADTSTNTSTATGYSTASATTGITASTVNPSGGVASITPTGSVSQPTFSGTQFDNRPAFARVIFCTKS